MTIEESGDILEDNVRRAVSANKVEEDEPEGGAESGCETGSLPHR